MVQGDTVIQLIGILNLEAWILTLAYLSCKTKINSVFEMIQYPDLDSDIARLWMGLSAAYQNAGLRPKTEF